MRTLTMNEVEQVSGSGPGGESELASGVAVGLVGIAAAATSPFIGAVAAGGAIIAVGIGIYKELT